MDAFVQSMADAIENSVGAALAVFLLSMIPIAEARFSILFGMDIGLKPIEAFGWAFLGSSLLAPILLLILMPIINALSKTKFFSKIGKFLYDKFEKKSRSLAETKTDGQKKILSKSELKRMGATALFVAVPLPLTGVWTGSAVASIVKIGYVKSVISIIVGNAAACGILTLIGVAVPSKYRIYVTLAFLAVVVIAIIVLIVKFILFKPKEEEKSVSEDNTDNTTDQNGINQ